MPWFAFIWTKENLRHIAEHGVRPEEAEHVVQFPDKVEKSRSSGMPIAFGYAPTGRYLAVVYELIDEATVYAITAYEVED